MNKKSTAVLLMVLAIGAATMACSISIPGLRVRPGFIPEIERYTAGELVEQDLFVQSRTEIVDLDIGFGAGELTVQPGSEGLLSGQAVYNVSQLEPVLTETGTRVSLTTGELNIDSFPVNVDRDLRNEWHLELGGSPMNLDMDIGAANANLDLGGLALENLTIDVGAADFTLDVSEPTTVEMDRFNLSSGASSVTLLHLGNMNTRRMSINTAAGEFDLDFTGDRELVSELFVEINMAAGQLRITVPESVAVRMVVEGALIDVNTHGSWTVSGSTYERAGEEGSGLITLEISAGAGQIDVFVD